MENNHSFKELLNSILRRRWWITALVLGTFILIVAGILAAIEFESPISGEWKELLLLMLGAFIGSYNKMIDYWFSNKETDQLLVQKSDEEDDDPEILLAKLNKTPITDLPKKKVDRATYTGSGTEIDENGDGVIDGVDEDGDGTIDIYFEHRQCEHVWVDNNNDGELECNNCGLIKEWFSKEGGDHGN